jgi:hypothetical protein
MSRTSVAVVLLFCIAGCAQEQRASASSDVKSNATTQTEFPTVPLHIAKQIDLDPGLGAGVGLPIQCGPDARMYVRFFNDDGDQALVGIAPDGTTTHFTLPFDLGLDNPTPLSLYATDAGVFGHVLGEKTTKLVHYKTPSGVDLGNRKVGPTSNHLVEFSLDGKFKRRVELDMPFKVLQLATFSSGMMLVAGVDSTTGTPTVALAKEDGTFLRPITIKGDLSPQAFKPDENDSQEWAR